jgi:DNA-binding transcriptional ArsR family regulator
MVLKVSNSRTAVRTAGRLAIHPDHDGTLDSLGGQVELFRALADPTRLEMVRMMSAQGEVACTTFLDAFNVTKSTISYHVRVLRAAHLVRIRKEGPWFFYQLSPSGFGSVVAPLLELVGSESAAPEPGND